MDFPQSVIFNQKYKNMKLLRCFNFFLPYTLVLQKEEKTKVKQSTYYEEKNRQQKKFEVNFAQSKRNEWRKLWNRIFLRFFFVLHTLGSVLLPNFCLFIKIEKQHKIGSKKKLNLKNKNKFTYEVKSVIKKREKIKSVKNISMCFFYQFHLMFFCHHFHHLSLFYFPVIFILL